MTTKTTTEPDAEGPDLPIEGMTSLAVTGVAKNCGKTTALNALLADEIHRGHTVGLLSIGIDGESTDRLVGIDKPDIILPADHWVVAGHRALEASSVRFEYVDKLDGSTPLGDILVARTLERGPVLLAGLRHREDARAARRALVDHGVERILIDGAYDRIVGTNPDLSDGVVLATGAVLGDTISEVIDATRFHVERLRLSPPDEPRRLEAIETALDRGRCLLSNPDGSLRSLSQESALVGLDELPGMWNTDTDTIAIPGAITDRVAEQLLEIGGSSGWLVASDPTSFQVSPDRWHRLSQHWTLCVHRAAALVGLALNPHRLQAPPLDGEALQRACADRWPELARFDPKRCE